MAVGSKGLTAFVYVSTPKQRSKRREKNDSIARIPLYLIIESKNRLRISYIGRLFHHPSDTNNIYDGCLNPWTSPMARSRRPWVYTRHPWV